VATGRHMVKPLGGRRRFDTAPVASPHLGNALNQHAPGRLSVPLRPRYGLDRFDPVAPTARRTNLPTDQVNAPFRMLHVAAISLQPTNRTTTPGDPAERKVLLLHEESRPFVQVRDETISIAIANQTNTRRGVGTSNRGLTTGTLTKANDGGIGYLEASRLKRRPGRPAQVRPKRNPISTMRLRLHQMQPRSSKITIF
jgi:hypothetical protein